MKKLFIEFSDFTPTQLYDVLKLRQDVFVLEQACLYEDFDGYDKQAIHLLITVEKELVAYARIFPPGMKYESESSIGRIVVKKSFRGTKIGKALIQSGIDYCKTKYQHPIRIEAQAALEKYYMSFGFIPEGNVYAVDDIDHIQMVL